MAVRAAGAGRLELDGLLSVTRRVAARLGAVSVLPVGAGRELDRLLHRDLAMEVWVRHWPAAAFEELHDHGDAAGALTVVGGDLVEWYWSGDVPSPWELARMTAEEATVGGPGLRRRVLAAGDTVGFPTGHVHDLGCRYETGAVTVQAYSPPLEARSFYGTVGGLLRHRRTESFLGRAAA